MSNHTKKFEELISKRDNLIGKINEREIESLRWDIDEKVRERKKNEKNILAKQKKTAEKKVKEKIKYEKLKKEEVKKRIKEEELKKKAEEKELKKKEKEELELIENREFEIDKEISLEQLRKIKERKILSNEKQKELERKIKEKIGNHISLEELKSDLDKKKKIDDKSKVLEKDITEKENIDEEKDESIDEEYSIEDGLMKEELKIDKRISLKEMREKKKKVEEKRRKENILKRKYELEEKNKVNSRNKLKTIIEEYSKDISNLREEISKTVVGQEVVVTALIRGFLANGHVLIEGVPGIAKTLLIRTIASASGCDFSRIQFTVDLLPTDITGVTTYNEKTNEFSTIKGPIFSNFIIGDEINRAPPKTQSALLEAMQEKQVTIGKETYKLPSPFFVMANNNPFESSGTYQLPEAQIDRFLFKVLMNYVSEDEEVEIIDKNMTIHTFSEFNVKPIISPKKIIEMQNTTKEILATTKIKKYVVNLVIATRNPKKYGINLGKYIEWGCSPRASIGIIIAAKADALMNGSTYITPQNVKNVAHDVLRHRISLNYRGQAENIKTDDIITEILNKIPLP